MFFTNLPVQIVNKCSQRCLSRQNTLVSCQIHAFMGALVPWTPPGAAATCCCRSAAPAASDKPITLAPLA
jgi:hypothetical protein